MQEELIQVLTTSSSSIRGLSLIQANLRSDFLNRLQAAFNTKSTDSSIGTHGFKAINLNRNSIEDKGLLYLANMFKENPRLCKELNQMSFSKCSISSKSINSLFAGTDFTSKLTHLNLSYNFLKDEPTVIYKFVLSWKPAHISLIFYFLKGILQVHQWTKSIDWAKFDKYRSGYWKGSLNHLEFLEKKNLA